MPSDGYTVLRAADAPDYTGDAHVPPGGDPTRGHSHRTIEEIYLVLEGELAVKVEDHGAESQGHEEFWT